MINIKELIKNVGIDNSQIIQTRVMASNKRDKARAKKRNGVNLDLWVFIYYDYTFPKLFILGLDKKDNIVEEIEVPGDDSNIPLTKLDYQDWIIYASTTGVLAEFN